ncbi:hypothetical protein FOL47_005933 [Perkinsus chesapeaki]|uniref:Uncharacterized protein n=1 Tax=Perkinsus chesapeaki TaxID=330153 RepID=A0A7J6LUU3_PERCH|nr:hypothetical protein FOL47_005933 [Perkinsus chesapeaki]
MRFLVFAALPFVAAAGRILKMVESLVGNKFVGSSKPKDMIASASIRFDKTGGVVRGRINIKMGKKAFAKGKEYQSPWLLLEEGYDDATDSTELVHSREDMKAFKEFVDYVTVDAYLTHQLRAFIGLNGQGKLQADIVVGDIHNSFIPPKVHVLIGDVMMMMMSSSFLY